METFGYAFVPQVRLHGVDYFADLRLREFREVDNPHEAIPFDSEEGGALCRLCRLVTCPHCCQNAVVHRDHVPETMACRRCEKVFPAASQ